MSDSYRICTRCIMDTTDPEIIFDENGVCNHCKRYDEYSSLYGYRKGVSEKELEKLIKKIKKDGKGKEYDAVLGISGGVDSAYLAHLAHEYDIRVLAVHVDAGWNSDVAVKNIEKLCKALDYDLHTIVMDWPTMKELQRAYMFSGLANLDIPQDHAFMTNTMKYAKKHNIKYMLNGSNYNTESILPKAWGYDNMDSKNIKSVYSKNGRGKSLKKYPFTGLFEYYLNRYTMKRINMLNYVDYHKKDAIELLAEKYDWEYYGGKHFESRFTKFFQSYYLPQKFGYDKKRAHLASLVASGEITRDDALKQMDDDSIYPMEQMLEDRDYIIKKLDISIDEWNDIMEKESASVDDYKNSKWIRRNITKFAHDMRRVYKRKK